MSFTSNQFRFLLAAAALCAASSADAKPRRVVVLDFDGPRVLADSGRDAVVSVLGEQYDLVTAKRWEEARADAQRTAHGPTSWKSAAKQSGVDAVIEGWVQDEGRHKVITVAVREAATGQEIDAVSVKLGSNGVTDDVARKLASELDNVLGFVEGGLDPAKPALDLVDPDDYRGKDAERPRKRTVVADTSDDGDDAGSDDRDHDDGEAKPRNKPTAKTDVATAAPDKASSDLVALFGPDSDEIKTIAPKTVHVPVPTPRFRIGGGGYYGSRSLTFGAENQTGPLAYAGVPSKGVGFAAEAFPFPTKKMDGSLSGVGVSFAVSQSLGSVVTFDDGDAVGEYVINQSAWKFGAHYRQPLGERISIDGEVNYGKSNYIIEDAPMSFEVPDTQYQYIGVGGHLDLKITGRASAGFGARYLYMLDTGDISSVDWYGPGRASGLALDGNFVVPLPSNLFLRGELAYQRIKIEFDDVGVITEAEGVYEASDATVNGSLAVGVEF
ncbi:MAG: hypothetical protein AB7O24_13705 [Kofleriaceae bacterium]